VLLAVTGLTPQVLTETLWALSERQQPPFVPTEIHLVTTTEGREVALLTLLDEETGQLQALAEEIGRPELARALTPERIHVAAGPDGLPLPDIRSAIDHVATADLLTAMVRELTADPTSALHVSIAGGRKTMSFLAGYVLSLFAREQDRMSHVLVAPPLEGHPQFFFPPRRPRVLLRRDDGRPVRTDPAAVTLADIPFVRLRDGLPDRLLERGGTFAEAIAAAQATLAEPELELDVDAARLTLGGLPLRLPPVQLAFLLLLAERRADGDGAIDWRQLSPAAVLEAYRRLHGHAASGVERLAEALRGGVSREWFQERKARHDKLVTVALGRRAGPYRLEPVGRRPRTRFRLSLPPERIRIHEGTRRP
jgi:CRISPR-associated protein (TIGR02584 family)